MTGKRVSLTRGGPAPRPYGKRGIGMTFWDSDQEPLVADELRIKAQWVGMDGWSLRITKRHVGQSWGAARTESYDGLDPGELLQVLDSSLGRWFAV